MSKAKYSKPMSMGEAARLVGFTGKRSSRRMLRYLRAREQALAASAADPDAGSHAPGLPEDPAVAAVRKEP